MFARFQDIKKGKLDEDGLGINNVADALGRVNIDILDAQGNFKDFTQVLNELYEVWDTLEEGSPERANIVKAMAGKSYARSYGNVTVCA